MTLAQLDNAMMVLSSKLGLDNTYVVDSIMSVTPTTESAAHELAHAIDLQAMGEIPKDAYSTRVVGTVIEGMSNAKANEHEFRTLRIEVAALRKLGQRIDGLWLFDNASFRGARKVARRRMSKRLTVGERKSVARFVAIVRKAAKS